MSNQSNQSNQSNGSSNQIGVPYDFAGQDVVEKILNGAYDTSLGDIAEAARSRMNERDRELMRARSANVTLQRGDRVCVRQDAPLRPTYRLGKTGHVTKVNQTTVTVTWEPGQYMGRFQGRPTRCPIGSLDKIDEPTPATS
jgi:hypothetical protein